MTQPAPLVITLIVGLVLVLVIAGVIPIRHGATTTHGRNPYEYVYLDPARVNAYLGQLNGGDINQETRINTIKDSTGAKIEVKAIGEANGSITHERVASAVVSFSEADNFFTLEKDLRSEETLETITLQACCSSRISKGLSEKSDIFVSKPVEISDNRVEQMSGEAREEESQHELEGLPIGKIVKLEDVLLDVPSYLAAYPGLRYSAFRYSEKSHVLLGPLLSALSETEVTMGSLVKREREKFILNAGANPRVPFSTKLHGLRIIIPARYDYITGDPSLLGTSVTVVGKVVYERRGYGDAASVATYLPALLRASRWFLEDMGFQEEFFTKYVGKHRRQELAAALFKALQNSLTFTGMSIEIVPIAIYS